ncbi:MAG: SDR family NAD(P)-dependent oxidoreductase, partial [Bacteroidota bacterium]
MRLSQRYPSKRAFVTGAASGFGRALCLELAAEGWTVGVADIDATGLADAAQAVTEAGGVADRFTLDVADPEQVQAAADGFVDSHGGVDLVINNAGIAVAGRLEETPLADWQKIIDINLWGVIHGCRSFVPYLRRAGQGHVVNVASAAAWAAGPRMSAYNVTKAGVRVLTETLYGELKAEGIDVSVVMPLFFQTNIGRNQLSSDRERALTERLVTTSGVTAQEVAQYTLRAAGNRKIHILYPRQSALLWRLKR